MDKSGCVVVTGASGAIGAAVAAALERAGLDVVGVDMNGAGRVRRVDVCVEDEVRMLAEGLRAEGRAVRGLVNIAGRPGEASLDDMSVALWDAVFAVNVRGTMLMTKHLLPLMSRGASIVNFGSIAALKGVTERTAYCASKAAVLGLTRAAAVELAPRGIRVNAVCPGTIDTPWIDRVARSAPDPAAAAIAMADRAPLRRTGTVDEVAACVVFLLDASSSFVTGATIPVDGGASAW